MLESACIDIQKHEGSTARYMGLSIGAPNVINIRDAAKVFNWLYTLVDDIVFVSRL